SSRGLGRHGGVESARAGEPVGEGPRGRGGGTGVGVEGTAEPIVASRTERAIITAMGSTPAESTRLLDEALDLAHRVADAAEQGRVDVVDLGRRARRVLASTAQPEPEGLF